MTAHSKIGSRAFAREVDMTDTKVDFEHLSIADALQQLNVDPKTGL